MSLLHYTDQQ